MSLRRYGQYEVDTRRSWKLEFMFMQQVSILMGGERNRCAVLCPSEDRAERAADEFPREPDILIALGNVYDLHQAMVRDGSGIVQVVAMLAGVPVLALDLSHPLLQH